MLCKLMSKKNKKGFTLVEVIVVLVILAIMAAILIPTLTGYIDKAREKTVIAEARSLLIATQTELSERYGVNNDLDGANNTILKFAAGTYSNGTSTIAATYAATYAAVAGAILSLSELPAAGAWDATITAKGATIVSLSYTSASHTASYTPAGGWTIS